jgi:hypothetical protein
MFEADNLISSFPKEKRAPSRPPLKYFMMTLNTLIKKINCRKGHPRRVIKNWIAICDGGAPSTKILPLGAKLYLSCVTFRTDAFLHLVESS